VLKKIFKSVIISGSILVLACSHVYAEDGSNLETLQQKESYSIGYQVGLSMKSDGVEVDFDKLIQGLRDAINEQKPLLSNEEMRSLIVERREKVREDQLRKVQEERAKNAHEAVDFLEENGKKEGVKTTESGLQYLIITEGEGESPTPEDMVTVHYRGTFIGGEEFDSSYAREKPQTFQANGVIRGWTEALQMMKVGSKWQIFVPPDLAYGRGGMGQRIPPNKLLVFEVELLSIKKNEETQK
jgi:FKBP-type peptidyl-prolyl cis-trans isomerase FklB